MFLIILGLFSGLMTLFLLVKFNDKSIYFGVRLPIDFELTEELKNVRKKYIMEGILYQITLFIITLILPKEILYGLMILIMFIYFGSTYLVFFKANAKVKAIKKRDKWSGYSENIVVVDLGNKKTLKEQKSISKILIIIPIILTIINFLVGMYIYLSTKDELTPSKFGSNGVVEEYIKKGDLVSITEIFTPFIAQLVLVLTIFVVYIGIVKSKNIINGGEVESLKEYNAKVKNSSVYYVTFTLTICELLFIGMYFINSDKLFIVAMIVLALIIITLFIYIHYYEKNIKPYRGVYKEKEGKTIINRDDDKNYVGGLFYNNPKDPSFVIPKRIGIGWDLNYGHTKTRVLSAVVIVILIASTIIIPFETKERIPEVTQNSIKISGLYGIEINRNEIASITLEAILPERLDKKNGIDMGTKLLGYFTEDKVFGAKLYISNTKEKVIRILKKDGSRVYINCNNKKDTEKIYNNLENYIK